MGEIGAQKCPLNVIGDPEVDVKIIGATSNLSKFCGTNLVLFGAISLLSVVAQQRLSILKVSCRNYTTRLLGSGCGPKKGSSQEISRLWCVSSARLPLTPAQRQAPSHLVEQHPALRKGSAAKRGEHARVQGSEVLGDAVEVWPD